ncbi:hypothetical protein B7H26_04655 [Stenotrophomonas maltophilia]|nr:hypothetical protein B7H26_04655 [Stenotrophomonas maltophilia]
MGDFFPRQPMPTHNERWAEAIALEAAGLVQLLSETRDLTPRPTDTDREVWMKIGEQRLLTHLRQLAENARLR